jgi:hypothetical protein
MRGHRDWAATSCPGKDLYAFLEDGSLLASVRDAVASGAPQLTKVCGAEAVERVADIEAGVL